MYAVDKVNIICPFCEIHMKAVMSKKRIGNKWKIINTLKCPDCGYVEKIK